MIAFICFVFNIYGNKPKIQDRTMERTKTNPYGGLSISKSLLKALAILVCFDKT